jgi:transcriptional regulator with XRE-family HTH domain
MGYYSEQKSDVSIIMPEMKTEIGLCENRFSVVFSELLEKSGVTCYQIHQYTRIDQAYLSRLKNGQRSNPSPELIMKIGLALTHLSNKVKISDIEDLLNSVGRSLKIRE